MATLLAFIPHPDDEAYSFAGTLALASSAGWRVIVIAATSGEGGKRHDGGPTGKPNVAAAREAELAASCAALGAQPPTFWHLPDGGLKNLPSQSPRVIEEIRRHQPALILTLGPDGAYGHPDHVALYRWVVEATTALGPEAPALLCAAFPLGLFLPQYQKCIAMMGDPPSPAPDEVGSGTFDCELGVRPVAALKRQAIAAHRSQLPNGDPEALFPPGIVASLMDTERFTAPLSPARCDILRQFA